MKNIITILFTLFLISSCRNSPEDKIELAQHKQIIKEQFASACEQYWKKIFPADSLKVKLLEEIISSGELTENNRQFLLALKNENDNGLAFEKALAPIFRISETEIGILSFPFYKLIDNRLIPSSAEMDLIEGYGNNTEMEDEHLKEIKFYPGLLDSVFKEEAKPTIYYYNSSKVDSTQIMELGIYVAECLEYFEYSIDTTNISINDSLLISSTFKIDLDFENDASVDSLIQRNYRAECQDCSNTTEFQKSFARLKGVDNLYFIYADTFPLNNVLDTPSRGLIYINKRKEIIYLWYDEIDLFGCSCL